MVRLLLRMTHGYRLTPWCSPYLRWRLETYSGVEAGTITPRLFWRLVWANRHQFVRYLRWAERMARG